MTNSFRVTVHSVLSSRYGNDLLAGSTRPADWDERLEGIDIIKTTEGKTLKLISDGGQSTPQAGWVILVTSGNETQGYRWTLFGMPKGCSIPAL